MAAPGTDQWARDRMVEALRLLALPPDGQLSTMPSFVDVPDELALTFDEAYRTLNDRKLTGAFTAEQAAGLADIDRVLEEMSRPPGGSLAWTPELLDASAWTIDALYTDERWAWVRRQARRLLRALGVDPSRPVPAQLGPDEQVVRPSEAP